MNEFEHGGNIHKILREKVGEQNKVLDFSANINPLGPPEWLRPLLSSQVESLIHYPDPEYTDFIEAISSFAGVSREHIVVGNGTTELLYTLMRVIPQKNLIIPVPSYVDYVRAAELGGKSIQPFELKEEEGFMLNCDRLLDHLGPHDAVIIATPNNPTGLNVSRDDLLHLIQSKPEALFIIDEAFLDFLEGATTIGGIHDNVITINSMTKFFGVPGLRVGYGIFPLPIATQMRKNLAPWTVNTFAQAVGVKALGDVDYQEKTKAHCTKLRQELSEELEKMHQLKVYPGNANYLFIKILQGGNAEQLFECCLKNDLIIRKCDNYQGLEDSFRFIRIAVRTKEENDRLLKVFRSYFGNTSLRKSK